MIRIFLFVLFSMKHSKLFFCFVLELCLDDDDVDDDDDGNTDDDDNDDEVFFLSITEFS